MSRKSLILCLSVLAAMFVLIALGVIFLYSGQSVSRAEYDVPDNNQFLLAPAIPTDALVVGCFSDPMAVLPGIVSDCSFASKLASSGLELDQMALSLHYVGKVVPLYIFNSTSSSKEDLISIAESTGRYAEAYDCNSLSIERKITGCEIVMVSPSKEVVKSSIRHLSAGESVISINDFAMAASEASGTNLLFVSNRNIPNLLPSFLTRKYSGYSRFISSVSDWVTFDLSGVTSTMTSLSGKFISDSDEPDIISVFNGSGAATSDVTAMLPSFTVSAVTLPFKDREEYITSYQDFLDSKQSLQKKMIQRNSLTDSAGIHPEEFFERLDVSEVATASFLVDGQLHSVNLQRINSLDSQIIFTGEEMSVSKESTPKVHPYNYGGYLESVFGDIFSLKDESSFTYMNGWIISGSDTAVNEYASGRALSYNLKEYMANADLPDLLSDSPSSLKAYLSLTEDRTVLSKIVSKDVLPSLVKLYEGADYSGIVLTLGANSKADDISIDLFRNEIKRSKAPVSERNTKVEISKGPFPVKNSHTGKMNQFYQRSDNNYLCLRDENGSNMWAAPFSAPICGTAHTIDFYANGKLQILFASGSRLYLIDRLGRFVQDCSVDLKKEILLGPAVYDFSGKRKYNVLVLHKDNTIEMYNLKGEIPSVWKTIKSDETIVSLPERIDVHGKTFWVVRTSVQTLIFPFGGGQPLTDFQGDQMILPESKVTVVDKTTVEVESYDGKKRKVKLI